MLGSRVTEAQLQEEGATFSSATKSTQYDFRFPTPFICFLRAHLQAVDLPTRVKPTKMMAFRWARFIFLSPLYNTENNLSFMIDYMVYVLIIKSLVRSYYKQCKKLSRIYFLHRNDLSRHGCDDLRVAFMVEVVYLKFEKDSLVCTKVRNKIVLAQQLRKNLIFD